MPSSFSLPPFGRVLMVSALAWVFVGVGCLSGDRIAALEGRNTFLYDTADSTSLEDSPSFVTSPSMETSSFHIPEDGSRPTPPTAPVGILPDQYIQDTQIRITTPKGEIVFETLPDMAPKAVSNFIALTRSGFYDGLKFHRVEPGFVIQGGDPLGTGYGGPGYRFEDEPVTLDYSQGIVAMANSGPNTNGSQFFIMLADVPLQKDYTIFGRVVHGMDTVLNIAVGDMMTTVVVEPKTE